MNITYNLNIPAGPNNPSNDQPLMEVNTNSINTWVGIDHRGFNTSDNTGGYHNIIHFVQQGSDPAPVGLTGQLYTKQVLSGGNTDEALFFESGGGRITQLTTNPNGTGAIGLPAANGWTTLPTGMIIQWGVVSVPSGLGGPFNFPLPFPNNFFSISLTMDRNSTASTSYDIFLNGTPSLTQFNTNSGTAGAHNVYFIAIGN